MSAQEEVGSLRGSFSGSSPRSRTADGGEVTDGSCRWVLAEERESFLVDTRPADAGQFQWRSAAGPQSTCKRFRPWCLSRESLV
jgi:hypothetical protein